ncbi:helix-turn-helix domain-containing protein [Agrobacterium pusense]|uniref:helix-turn-helix domain-containing protein n=1 Tax=Agrobacterium pusense TaxID=648995 RepID=UPI0028B02138|nr:helix-turn-helix domain-containing protein [Agrobacterium pusense]
MPLSVSKGRRHAAGRRDFKPKTLFRQFRIIGCQFGQHVPDGPLDHDISDDTANPFDTRIDMNLHETVPEARKLIPGMKFTTAAFERRDQFDAWCDFTSSMCDLEAIESPKAGFLASAESYYLGSLQLTSFKLSPMRFKYTNDIIRKASIDHWCISVVTKGTAAAATDDRGFRAMAGDTVLHSYARPFEGRMEVTDYSGLFLSRDEFWDVADQLDNAAHQQVRGPMSYILGDFIASLEQRASKLTVSEGKAVNDAFGHLLRAMVRQTPGSMEAARAPIAAAQFERARRYINAHLKSPGLTPDMICRNVGLSRRQLYYLFEQHGGVATYIRNRRLAASYNVLIKSVQKRQISQVAYEYGFSSLSSFSRQFHARYGFAPGEARAAWLAEGKSCMQEAGIFVDWLQLSEDS